MECLRDQAENVKSLAGQVQGVSEVHSTSSGDYDVVIKVQTEDEQRLKSAVSAIKGIGGIMVVMTSIAYGNRSRKANRQAFLNGLL